MEPYFIGALGFVGIGFMPVRLYTGIGIPFMMVQASTLGPQRRTSVDAGAIKGEKCGGISGGVFLM